MKNIFFYTFVTCMVGPLFWREKFGYELTESSKLVNWSMVVHLDACLANIILNCLHQSSLYLFAYHECGSIECKLFIHFGQITSKICDWWNLLGCQLVQAIIFGLLLTFLNTYTDLMQQKAESRWNDRNPFSLIHPYCSFYKTAKMIR